MCRGVGDRAPGEKLIAEPWLLLLARYAASRSDLLQNMGTLA